MDSSYQQNYPSDDNNDPSKNNNNDDPSKNNNNDNPSKKRHSKKGKGRQKIPMEKIESETSRKVTFTKRRNGLFKKASELHTLCDAENAFVVYSPSNKAHSFGAPNIKTVTDRFLNVMGLGGTGSNQMPPPRNNSIARQRNLELTNLERQLEDEKRKKKEHDMLRKANPNQIGYPPNLDLLDSNQLQTLKDNLMGLKNALNTLINNAADKGVDPCAGSGGPGVGQPMDPNAQGLSSYNMAGQFYYGHNGTMLNNMDPFVPGGALNNYQAPFDFGGNNNNNPGGALNNYQAPFEFGGNNNNNPNGGFMNDARAGYYNDPEALFFPDMLTNSPGYVDPYDTTVNNNNEYQFQQRPNDHEAGSSNPVFPYNFGYPNDEVPNENDTGGASADGVDGEGGGGGAQGNARDEWGGSNFNNFGPGN
ncbi:hypothetical protein CASFOL_042462 [Castilleja foliolosa]|uniref:MADS-box domain-containing protein n=1 Tax=Castilleja foliolosa TaxID=1961234 RepID=A0ABD3BB14_9LAMI